MAVVDMVTPEVILDPLLMRIDLGLVELHAYLVRLSLGRQPYPWLHHIFRFRSDLAVE